MERVSVSIPHQLLPSLEASLGMSCNALTWMEWWVGALFEFEESLPEEKRKLFHRVVVSGGKTLNYVARHNLGNYTNLLLLHRDKLIKDFSPQVPAEEVSLLRNAELPTVPLVFPSDLTSSATGKKHAASQDALVMQALTSKIPRVSGSRVSKGKEAGTSGSSSTAGVSPVVPRRKQGASSGPSPNSCRGRKKRKGRRGAGRGGGRSYCGAPGVSGQTRGAGKGRGWT